MSDFGILKKFKMFICIFCCKYVHMFTKSELISSFYYIKTSKLWHEKGFIVTSSMSDFYYRIDPGSKYAKYYFIVFCS